MATFKKTYIAASTFRKLVYINSNYLGPDFNKTNYFCFYDRKSSIIPLMFKRKFYIYNGKGWKKVRVNRWSVGMKFGSFTWNRRIAIFKAKQLKKKGKKKGKK